MSELFAQLAQALFGAEQNAIALEKFGEAKDLSLDDAYAIAALNVQRRQEAGERLVGHKIGITSAAVMNWLKVDQPDFGALFEDMALADGGELSLEKLLQPRAEGEIAFVLKEDLAEGGITAARVLSATDYVLPCIEIVDSRVKDWDIAITDTIADNASSSRFVMGTQATAVSGVEFMLCGMVLRKNGEVVSTGAGVNCLDNPVNAVVWLAKRMQALGTPLRAGQIILSGALGPVIELAAGDYLELEIAGMGRTQLRITS
ncbi:MAG: 2-oxopent-4-enoate hydratase [Deltaproteobacteria bacterium]|nr:2-oxopent-4-enoate hydratase [Deltaproteobacteria bacterium]